MEKDDSIQNSAYSKEFAFPLNIKQMGNIDKELKIYVEDYVYTYLCRYAKTMAKKEKIAVLAGRYYKIDDCDTVVISGAIQGKFSENIDGNEVFTDETWNYVNEEMTKYFPSLSVMGWVRVQPEFGTLALAKDESFHKECFKNKRQVFFVSDPVEEQDCFYTLDDSGFNLRRVKGYFIYYDKNEAMQDYMINNPISVPKGAVLEEESTEEFDTSGKAALNRLLGITGKNRKNLKPEEEKETEKYVPDRIDAAGKIRDVLNKKEIKKKEEKGHRVLLTAVCLILCIVCAGLGQGIMKDRDKIRLLEEEISSVKASYLVMTDRLEEASAQVFSMQNAMSKMEEEEKYVEEEINYKEYTIEEGDSLWYICRKFYGGENKIEEIKALNNIENEDKLFAGQTIKLP